MCQFCQNIGFDLWKKLQIGQQFRTPDLYKGKDFQIEEKSDAQIKIQPQNIVISREAFSAAISYLRENNHFIKTPCEIQSLNSTELSGPLCKAARQKKIKCINYILPILQKKGIAEVNPVCLNTTWLIVI